MTITPETKSWTWVLERPCPDCGFDAPALDRVIVGRLVRENATVWPALLAHPRARVRPADDRWSALEYACHVRDTFAIFDGRLQRMLGEDHPRFANWDQDQSAIDEHYDRQDPAVVATDLGVAAARIADRFDTVRGAQWNRRGTRSDGADFTVDSFARYFLHDPVHHVHDVVMGNERLASG